MRVPFTDAGVKIKQQELYALHDRRLSAEAEYIQHDFVAWVLDNFKLTLKQRDCLYDINTVDLQVSANTLSKTVLNREEIVVIDPGNPQYSSKEFAVAKGGTGPVPLPGDEHTTYIVITYTS